MISLLKAFGKGLIYLVTLPALVVVLAFYLVIGIVIFIYIGLKGIILFFSGRNLQELPEDIKAREILEGMANQDNESVQIEETKVEEVKPQGFASNYYVPLDTNIPPVKEEPTLETENVEKKEDEENV